MLFEAVVHLQHYVSSLLSGVEDASAVRKTARIVVQFGDFAGGDLESAHTHDGLRDLLAVGADILHRRSAHSSGNAAQALQAGAVFADSESHHLIPILAGAGTEEYAGTITR